MSNPLPWFLPSYLPGPGLAFPVPNPVEYIESHCEDAKAHVTEDYKRKPRFLAFLCAVADQLQEVETAFWDLYTRRSLATAYGDQLDGLGSIVGEPRKDRTDEQYRVFLRVRILVNLSNGQVEDLLAIMRQAFTTAAPVGLTEHFPASIQIVLYSDITNVAPDGVSIDPLDFVLYLRAAKPAGVWLNFGWVVTPLEDAFVWDDVSAPFTTSGQWWGSTTGSPVGGAWGGVS